MPQRPHPPHQKVLDTSATAWEQDQHGWREEGLDLLRGIAAGSIVGMPLLYTMEMWWHGMTMGPRNLLLLLAVTLLVNFLFSLFSGFRRTYSAAEAASESVTAVGISIAYSCAVLCLIGEITFENRWSDILGKVLVETAPVSLGVSFANYQVRNKSRSDGDEGGQPGDGGNGAAGEGTANQAGDAETLQLRQDLTDLAATGGGAMIFAYNLAPTEEILKIAARLSPWQQLLLTPASLLLCYMILFAAGFQRRMVYVASVFQSPWAETVMAYAVALLVAFVLLWLVGVPEATAHPSTAAACTVTLALPAVVGASAGRLIA